MTATPPESFASSSSSFSLIVTAGRFLDLPTNLTNASLDLGPFAGAPDDGGLILVGHHARGTSELLDRDMLKLDAQVLGDQVAAGSGFSYVNFRLRQR